ncbi:hypothetical protein Pint_05798 [Pistacia integerrima]|uniref:Uncharacterized protein n=1 Tax=Pistacia integerrima TaxID=434235 RepID=A0ACC0Z3W3_9ROSI|nr:hypothetical protein Pint_05798 [Pistacia integerrima]
MLDLLTPITKFINKLSQLETCLCFQKDWCTTNLMMIQNNLLPLFLLLEVLMQARFQFFLMCLLVALMITFLLGCSKLMLQPS